MKRTLFLGRLFGKEKSKETQKSYSEVEKDQKISRDKYTHGGSGREFNDQAMYFPRHSKFKGYMKNTRNWGRKKKAA